MLLHTGIEVKVLDVIVISTVVDQRDVFNLWSEGKREGEEGVGERDQERERERKIIILKFRKLRSKGVFGCSNLSSTLRSFQLRTAALSDSKRSLSHQHAYHIHCPSQST